MALTSAHCVPCIQYHCSYLELMLRYEPGLATRAIQFLRYYCLILHSVKQDPQPDLMPDAVLHIVQIDGMRSWSWLQCQRNEVWLRNFGARPEKAWKIPLRTSYKLYWDFETAPAFEARLMIELWIMLMQALWKNSSFSYGIANGQHDGFQVPIYGHVQHQL